MANVIKTKHTHTIRRAIRTRARISGTPERPRMSVKRSIRHTYVQLIDDVNGNTLASASDKDIKEKGKPIEIAHAVGKLIAERAKAAGIKVVVFDRGSYRYHGRVAAVAQGAREGGLTI